MQATDWSQPRSQRFKPAAPCEACEGPDSTAILSQAQVLRSDVNHSIGIVILTTCPVLPQRVRGKTPSDAADRDSHSADGGRGTDACGLRLCRCPLAGARILAR